MRKPPNNRLKRILKVRALKLERLRYRSIKKRRRTRKTKLQQYRANKSYRDLAKGIKNYVEAINIFMPKNLKYIIQYSNSPFCKQFIIPKKLKKIWTIKLPKVFSILENPEASYNAIKEIIDVLICQKYEEVWIDYQETSSSDLLTQAFLDTILRDWDRFWTDCLKAGLNQFMRVRSFGGRNYFNDSIARMVNSVGSPAIILKRKQVYPDLIPFNLRYFNKAEESQRQLGAGDEGDITLLMEYVNECLTKFGKELTRPALDALGTVLGETVINASEHSTLKSRYLIGYFDYNTKGNKQSHGLLHLVILNYGQSVYEKFKYPTPGTVVNEICIRQMQELSDSYTKRGLFSINKFKESTLWTLYALQQGVTIIPNANRGNGTVQFIEKFFNLREGDNENESRMYLLSGNTVIEFDGTYKIVNIVEGQNNRAIMAFNQQGNLRDKPDERYVRYTEHFFPGTAIYARISLNKNILKDES